MPSFSTANDDSGRNFAARHGPNRTVDSDDASNGDVHHREMAAGELHRSDSIASISVVPLPIVNRSHPSSSQKFTPD
jgi:hypothetical protein